MRISILLVGIYCTFLISTQADAQYRPPPRIAPKFNQAARSHQHITPKFNSAAKSHKTTTSKSSKPKTYNNKPDSNDKWSGNQITPKFNSASHGLKPRFNQAAKGDDNGGGSSSGGSGSGGNGGNPHNAPIGPTFKPSGF